LDRTYYTFSTSDNGSKTFTSLVRFRTSWEFRLKFTEDNDSSVYGTRTFNVGGSSYYYNSSSRYYYSYGNFSDNELKKIRAVYDIWDNVISALERDIQDWKIVHLGEVDLILSKEIWKMY
jgi:hypothetical protein